MSRFWKFVLQVSALLAYCGGPLLIADELKPRVGKGWAFALTFIPILLLIFGAFPLLRSDPDEEDDRFDAVSVRGGQIGIVLLLASNVYAVWALAQGRERADSGLVAFGIVVGIGVSIGYAVRARRYFAR